MDSQVCVIDGAWLDYFFIFMVLGIIGRIRLISVFQVPIVLFHELVRTTDDWQVTIFFGRHKKIRNHAKEELKGKKVL